MLDVGDPPAEVTTRPAHDAAGRWQVGAIGHGPTGHPPAVRIVASINVWDRGRPADPELDTYPWAPEPIT